MMDDELEQLVRKVDTQLHQMMVDYEMDALKLTGVLLARLTILNYIHSGVPGLQDYKEILEHVWDSTDNTIYDIMDVSDMEEEMLASEHTAQIIPFRRKDETTR
jgi:hypothetical protein